MADDNHSRGLRTADQQRGMPLSTNNFKLLEEQNRLMDEQYRSQSKGPTTYTNFALDRWLADMSRAGDPNVAATTNAATLSEDLKGLRMRS
ncbi:MAG: hypothetical protein M1825_005017 [Sarcosagium campestre]|nr:MAG: hypothetical protein M1825_005017 [Sarcosagium campestre]